MADRKPKAEVEIQVPVQDPVVQTTEDFFEEVKEGEIDPALAPRLALNEHVRDLVALYANEIFQELEQRIRDLEMLVGQPTGAVQFGPPQQPLVRDPVGTDVPWYQPSI